MADDYKPLQGDEAELFALYNHELLRRVQRAVNTSPAIVEDACSIAWAQFLRHQPDRNRQWRAWLFKTAQREAWSLDRARRETKPLAEESADGRWWFTEPLDPHDVYRERDELEAAVEVLEQLPPRGCDGSPSCAPRATGTATSRRSLETARHGSLHSFDGPTTTSERRSTSSTLLR